MAFVIYELEDIGAGDTLEAVAVHWYCSKNCQNDALPTFPIEQAITVSAGNDGSAEDGAHCEMCDKEL